MKCEHCGAKIVAKKHKLTDRLLGVLVAMYETTHEPISIAELPILSCHWKDVKKLAYWSLVKDMSEPGDYPGVWQITQAGLNFCRGLCKIPNSVWVEGHRVVGFGQFPRFLSIQEACRMTHVTPPVYHEAT